MSVDLAAAVAELLQSEVAREGNSELVLVGRAALENLRSVMGRSPQLPEHALVTVSGGVAYVARTTEGTEVDIVDYDDLAADFSGTFARLSRQAQRYLLDTDDRSAGLSGGLVS